MIRVRTRRLAPLLGSLQLVATFTLKIIYFVLLLLQHGKTQKAHIIRSLTSLLRTVCFRDPFHEKQRHRVGD